MNQRISVITPDVAQFILENNNVANYRKINKKTVLLYARDMKDGRWQETGVPIVIDENGILTDGQHRLAAIVESGIAQKMLVVEGVPAGTNAYDIGRSRTYGDLLYKEDISFDTAAIGLARCICAEQYRPSKVDVSKILTVECLKRHNKIITECIKLIRAGESTAVCRRRSVGLGCCALLVAGENPCELEDFFRCANTGFPAAGRESSPPIVLRNQIQNADRYTNDRQLCHATIQAFRDFKNGVARRKAYTAKAELDSEILDVYKKIKAMEEEND